MIAGLIFVTHPCHAAAPLRAARLNPDDSGDECMIDDGKAGPSRAAITHHKAGSEMLSNSLYAAALAAGPACDPDNIFNFNWIGINVSEPEGSYHSIPRKGSQVLHVPRNAFECGSTMTNLHHPLAILAPLSGHSKKRCAVRY